MNPEFPSSRLAAIVDEAEPLAIILTRENLDILRKVQTEADFPIPHVIVMDTDSDEDYLGLDTILAQNTLPVHSGVVEDDLAYLMFTSGTTGRPKGVMVQHRAAMNFVWWAAHFFNLTPADRMSNHSSLSFDLSVLDLFAPLIVGATICPLRTFGERTLASRTIKSRGITVWFSVPSVITHLRRMKQLSRAAMGDSLRLALFCGEALSSDNAAAWIDAMPEVPIFNLYGPTEAAIACTWHRVTSKDVGNRIPIGQPCPNVTLSVIDLDTEETVPAGSSGRLMIGGSQLSPGYWRRLDLTEAVFRPDPRKLETSARYYETGDLAYQDANGIFYCLGRSDTQIKYMGYRIELSEIEHTISTHPDAIEAAVVLVDAEEPFIAAAVVWHGESSLASSLREHCAATLPSYMIPAQFQASNTLPKNVNGKIDRNAIRQSFKSAK